MHKILADYDPLCLTNMVLPAVPSLKVLRHQSQLWDLLSGQLS